MQKTYCSYIIKVCLYFVLVIMKSYLQSDNLVLCPVCARPTALDNLTIVKGPWSQAARPIKYQMAQYVSVRQNQICCTLTTIFPSKVFLDLFCLLSCFLSLNSVSACQVQTSKKVFYWTPNQRNRPPIACLLWQGLS